MSHLPLNASDEELVRFVDGWARLLEAEDYDGAFAYTSHSPCMHWSPELLREVVKGYDESLPTQRVTVDGVATDISQRKDVNRYPSPRPGGIGYIWYDLNIDGVVSDLTATFDIQVGSGGLVVVLNEISVM